MTRWYCSPYTGLFSRFSAVPSRPHDPEVYFASGTVSVGAGELNASGAGWDREAAEGACVGEAIERWQARPLPDDVHVEASYSRWPLDEPAIEPGRWVLFHPEQYLLDSFPFAPLTPDTVCRWVCCREALSGEPRWVPQDLVYLTLGRGERHRHCPGLSTGLACGPAAWPVLLRGLQEVIERDAVVGAWWGRYPLEEWAPEEVFASLSRPRERLVRPNLRYRCFRVVTPLCDHVTVVTLEGEDREGYCFSAGSACREARAASWNKSVLEAVHGRSYVRYLKAQFGPAGPQRDPEGFAEHAVFYSYHRDLLPHTPFGDGTRRAPRVGTDSRSASATMADLVERLGPDRPVLFRNLTPPALGSEGLDGLVLRVVVPGLQPLHGHHSLPHLGGPLWAPRALAEYAVVPPHPFP